MRFDVALFQLRLFKSRSQASAAIDAGEALLNGERSKSSREVRAGDRVTLTAGPSMRTVEILELPGKSVSREAARAMVREVPQADARGGR